MTDEIIKENEQLRDALEELRESVRSFDKLCNLRGWAIDRAVSIMQVNRNASAAPTFEEVKDLAEALALYSYGDEFINMKKEAANLGETLQ